MNEAESRISDWDSTAIPDLICQPNRSFASVAVGNGTWPLAPSEPPSAHVLEPTTAILHRAGSRGAHRIEGSTTEGLEDSRIFQRQTSLSDWLLYSATRAAHDDALIFPEDSLEEREQCVEILEHVRNRSSRRSAYDAADSLVSCLEDATTRGPELEIAAYLMDDQSLWRDVVLGTLADHDVTLDLPALRSAILQLLHAGSSRLMHAAALSLYAGGVAAQDSLRKALRKHPMQEDLQELLRLVE